MLITHSRAILITALCFLYKHWLFSVNYQVLVSLLFDPLYFRLLFDPALHRALLEIPSPSILDKLLIGNNSLGNQESGILRP